MFKVHDLQPEKTNILPPSTIVGGGTMKHYTGRYIMITIHLLIRPGQDTVDDDLTARVSVPQLLGKVSVILHCILQLVGTPAQTL